MSTIYTDSSKVEKIKKECKKKTNKNIQKSKRKEKEDKKYYCLVCNESYNKSKPNEKSEQYCNCNDWSYEECTDQNDLYKYLP